MRRRYMFTLIGRFKHLYRGWDSSDPNNFMTHGFQCGDGWFRLLLDLSQQIEDYRQQHPEATDLIVLQVKQEDGGLRFDVSPSIPALQQLIEQTKKKSRRTCEQTGNPGILFRSPDGVYQTLSPGTAAQLGFEPVRMQGLENSDTKAMKETRTRTRVKR